MRAFNRFQWTALGFLMLAGVGCSTPSTAAASDADFCPPPWVPVAPPPPDLTAPQCTGQLAIPNAALASSPIANMVAQAPVVIRGTIVLLHASIATVRLDRIVYSSDYDRDTLVPFVGTNITVALGMLDLPVGASALFLARVTDYTIDADLTLSELGHFVDADGSLAAAIPAVKDLFAREGTYARVATSDRIVAGTVASVSDLPATCLAIECPPSEHCTEWGEAIIDVDAVLCGGPLPPPMRVAFATSIDIAWYRAPKLAIGQTAVLFVHHTDVSLEASATPPDLVVLDPLDAEPRDQESAVRALLASPPRP